MLKSIFGALGIGKKDEPEAKESSPIKHASDLKPAVSDLTKYHMPKAGPNQMDMMDVESMLDDLAKANPQELN